MRHFDIQRHPGGGDYDDSGTFRTGVETLVVMFRLRFGWLYARARVLRLLQFSGVSPLVRDDDFRVVGFCCCCCFVGKL